MFCYSSYTHVLWHTKKHTHHKTNIYIFLTRPTSTKFVTITMQADCSCQIILQKSYTVSWTGPIKKLIWILRYQKSFVINNKFRRKCHWKYLKFCSHLQSCYGQKHRPIQVCFRFAFYNFHHSFLGYWYPSYFNASSNTCKNRIMPLSTKQYIWPITYMHIIYTQCIFAVNEETSYTGYHLQTVKAPTGFYSLPWN